MKNEGKLCPSSKFKKGASLIGIRNDKDEMDILKEPIKVTEELYKQFKEVGTKPEKTLRFTNKCIESGCKQWTGIKCGVIDTLLQDVEQQFIKDALPECAIRDTCRWFSQSGPDACKICPLVTTYVEDPKDNQYFHHDI